jgi:hypothetical protein
MMRYLTAPQGALNRAIAQGVPVIEAYDKALSQMRTWYMPESTEPLFSASQNFATARVVQRRLIRHQQETGEALEVWILGSRPNGKSAADADVDMVGNSPSLLGLEDVLQADLTAHLGRPVEAHVYDGSLAKVARFNPFAIRVTPREAELWAMDPMPAENFGAYESGRLPLPVTRHALPDPPGP